METALLAGELVAHSDAHVLVRHQIVEQRDRRRQHLRAANRVAAQRVRRCRVGLWTVRTFSGNRQPLLSAPAPATAGLALWRKAAG